LGVPNNRYGVQRGRINDPSSSSAGSTLETAPAAGPPLPRVFIGLIDPTITLVGLPDKAVSEARERVRSALIASGLALPARRITVNLAPADLPKEGSHYDLPIALGLMAAIGAIPPDALSGFTVLGELGLDGSIAPVAGVLPAAIGANARDEGLICPAACGAEAAWASPEIQIVAAASRRGVRSARRITPQAWRR